MHEYHITWDELTRCYVLYEWNNSDGKSLQGYPLKRWTKEEFNLIVRTIIGKE